jgi:predicted nucleic acid-binding protein
LTLLDAYALIALVADEPAAEEVEGLLRGAQAAVVVTNLSEAVDVLQRVYDSPPPTVEAAIQPLIGSVLAARSSTEEDAWRAAGLRSHHYARGSSELSLADCLLLAAARPGDRIATADPALAAVARAEGVDVLALPDRTGRRP